MTPHYLILGGTKGIGRALGHQLASRGALVSAVGLSQPDARNDHPNIQIVRDDAATMDFAPVEARGPLSGLICCQRYRGVSSDTWAHEWNTTINATKRAIEWTATHCQAPASIVVIGSAASALVIGDQPVSYHVAKAAILHLMRYYAVHLGPQGIRINAVSPGAIVKEESAAYYAGQTEKTARYQQLVPLGRMGRADDVVRAVLFLLSDQSSFITGHNLIVDGGVSIRGQEAVALESPAYA